MEECTKAQEMHKISLGVSNINTKLWFSKSHTISTFYSITMIGSGRCALDCKWSKEEVEDVPLIVSDWKRKWKVCP